MGELSAQIGVKRIRAFEASEEGAEAEREMVKLMEEKTNECASNESLKGKLRFFRFCQTA
jgi:hypothetical protein